MKHKDILEQATRIRRTSSDGALDDKNEKKKNRKPKSSSSIVDVLDVVRKPESDDDITTKKKKKRNERPPKEAEDYDANSDKPNKKKQKVASTEIDILESSPKKKSSPLPTLTKKKKAKTLDPNPVVSVDVGSMTMSVETTITPEVTKKQKKEKKEKAKKGRKKKTDAEKELDKYKRDIQKRKQVEEESERNALDNWDRSDLTKPQEPKRKPKTFIGGSEEVTGCMNANMPTISQYKTEDRECYGCGKTHKNSLSTSTCIKVKYGREYRKIWFCSNSECTDVCWTRQQRRCENPRCKRTDVSDMRCIDNLCTECNANFMLSYKGAHTCFVCGVHSCHGTHWRMQSSGGIHMMWMCTEKYNPDCKYQYLHAPLNTSWPWLQEEPYNDITPRPIGSCTHCGNWDVDILIKETRCINCKWFGRSEYHYQKDTNLPYRSNIRRNVPFKHMATL